MVLPSTTTTPAITASAGNSTHYFAMPFLPWIEWFSP
jgi:hypothetical protein